MELSKVVKLFLFALVLVLFLTGCERDGKDREKQKEKADKAVKHARQLWDEIENYEQWTVPEGFEGWQDGVSPHGKILKYYINEEAVENLTGDGSVIVKENYSEKSPEALTAITIMEKRAGYDPETENWFYVKYSPEGKVIKNDKGMPLAGLVGKGKTAGCIPCHKTAGGGDYLFMND